MANRIGELRRGKGLTLKEMGELLNIRDNTLSQYETGKREPQLGTMIEIANFFGVSLEYLMGKTDKRDYPLDTDDDAIKLLQKIESKEISYYDISTETSLKLALWSVENQKLLKEKYPKLFEQASFIINHIQSENRSLKWYTDLRKKDNAKLDRIIELLELTLDDEFNGASVSDVLEFLEESERISYEDLKKTLEFMRNCDDDTLEDY